MAEGRLRYIFNAEPDTAELFLRSVVSVYQFSFYGAVADWCAELASSVRRCQVIPMVHYGANERGNTMKKLTIFQKIFNLQKLVPTQDLQEKVSEGQHSITIPNVSCGRLRHYKLVSRRHVLMK